MNHPFFFGYGSLVNRDTHDFPHAARATIPGWRRAWRHARNRPAAYLTVVPCAASEIDGLIAGVPDADWAALDHRERAYDRVPAESVRHDHAVALDIHIYHVPEGKHAPATTAHPILLSYVDVVVQGFAREYGRAGVARFFETTDGWEAPILNDRDAPRYARHKRLSRSETALVDDWLTAVGARTIAATGDDEQG